MGREKKARSKVSKGGAVGGHEAAMKAKRRKAARARASGGARIQGNTARMLEIKAIMAPPSATALPIKRTVSEHKVPRKPKVSASQKGSGFLSGIVNTVKNNPELLMML
jgi:hypothetical protein